MTVAAIPASHLKLKRAYEPAATDDGTRILVDRLWPRGVSKADAAVDHWFKEVAPSAGLRKWFGHKPERWLEFQSRYVLELRQQAAVLNQIGELARQGTVTLVFGARDEIHNDAVVLREVLLRNSQPRRPRSQGEPP